MTAKAGPGRRGAQFYDVTLPSGRVVRPARGMAWRFTRDRFDELVADGRVTFGPRGDSVPRLKRFLSETRQGLVPTTWWPGLELGTTDTAKKQLRRLFPALVPFETPKPEELVARVVQIASDPGDLVLDCFAGSGTTPAVAHKLRRRWFAVERELRTVEDFLVPRLDTVVAGADPGGVTRLAGWRGGGAYTVSGLPAPMTDVA
jgi:adenine-specific DNA-methyltransferase